MQFISKPIDAGSDAAVNRRADPPSPAATRSASPTMEREDWNRRYASEGLLWTADANRFLVAETANLLPRSALDLASGEGRNAVWLAEQGWTVQAVDFSNVAIEKARQLAAARNVIDKIDFQESDLRAYEPEVHHFDLVALIYLQIPQAELAPILLRAARAVAPGGTFVLVAHDSENLQHGYGGPQRADLLYTAEQVVTALGGEIEIEKAVRVARPVKTSDGIKVAIDCLVRGKRL